jgi:hypothetical protein
MSERKKPFRLVGGTETSEAAPAKRGRRQEAENSGSPTATHAEDEKLSPDAMALLSDLAAKAPFRDRATVARNIKGHINARRAYQQGMAWLVAAEDQNLPSASVEPGGRQDVLQRNGRGRAKAGHRHADRHQG